MSNVIEEKLIINGGIKIGATISYTKKSVKNPLVLLIMGTGKTDRDGNSKGFKTNFYKELSDMFVNFGYVCIRYDKRGTYDSTGNYNTSGLMDLVNDAKDVVKYVKNLDYIDENNIYICGHSEGAMIASLLSEMEKTKGLILIGGACTCMKSALMYQNSNVLNEFKNKKGLLAWYVRKVVKQEKIDKQVISLFAKAKTSKKERYFFNGAFMNTAWMKEHGNLSDDDYVNILKKYDGKILAITGKSDLSADYHSLDKIKNLDNVTLYTPKKVNHILREIDDDNSYMHVKKQYKRLSKLPIHQETENIIKEWLNKE